MEKMLFTLKICHRHRESSYIMDSTDAQDPYMYVICPIDPDDFVHVWGMSQMDGSYEKWYEFATVG